MGLPRYDDAVSAYKNGLEIDPNNEALKSGLAAASGTSFTSPLGDVFAGSEMWARLESDPTTRAFLQQGDFKNKMLDVQENPSTLNRHLKDPRIVQALGSEALTLHRPEEFRLVRARTKRDCTEKDHEVERRKLGFRYDEAAAAEEEEAFDGGLSRARHRVVLGLGINTSDYEKLEVTLKGYGVPTVKVSRIDWLRNAAGLADPNYWWGTLRPRSVLDWYLKRVDEAVNEANKLAEADSYRVAIRPLLEEDGNVVEVALIKDKRTGQQQAYRNRAACYIKLGAMPEGLKDAVKCIELDPSFARGYSRKGITQFFMKEYDKALEMYQEGLKHEPRNQELLDGVRRCVEQINILTQFGYYCFYSCLASFGMIALN
ncbi:stress-inducible protein [Actinidia rufa]|uniref:Stress-inducible protein n=1 Tax=Actinidia rufa TaxID=165716 RepID=A0A7J0G591_9ERIC|nr:stress-inducible protein [Actinidia rufa]